jgi:hypothetical protein
MLQQAGADGAGGQDAGKQHPAGNPVNVSEHRGNIKMKWPLKTLK